MALWTDILTPTELTGYARRGLAEIEAQKGTLAYFLPNRYVADDIVRFSANQTGLVEEAKFRAFDAEPEMAKEEGGRRVVIEIPAVSQKRPVSEYEQLRLRNASEQALADRLFQTADRTVRAIADRVERLRGTVLSTGAATIDQENFKTSDDFGRDARLTMTATTLFSDANANPQSEFQKAADLYEQINGVRPGIILAGSTAIVQAIQNNKYFAVQGLNGTSFPATADQMNLRLAGADLPPVVAYTRRTSGGPIIPTDSVLFLPAPVSGPDAWDETDLGGTFWGQTLTSIDPTYALADVDMPGLVVGAYRNEMPPMIAEVVADAIAMPVLANANLSAKMKVL